MLSFFRGLWRDRRNQLWVLPACTSLLAVVLALVAAWLPKWLPSGVSLPVIEVETLGSLLTVVSSSMLAVTTFSLSIMVSAFASASSGVTPRATELVMGDEGTREAIATFLSAFIFSVVAQVALGLGYYGDEGRFFLFVGTLGVLVWLIVALLRWVRTLSSLGRLGNTLARVSTMAQRVLAQHWVQPRLGAQVPPANLSALMQDPQALLLRSKSVRFVRSLDLAALQTTAEQAKGRIHLCKRPGTLVGLGDVLAVVQPEAGVTWGDAQRGELLDAVRAAVHMDSDRTFDQDPRFGLIVLREAGQKALSSAINDPGTSIGCLNAITQVLLDSQVDAQTLQAGAESPLPTYDRLSLPALDDADFLSDTMDALSRDGAGCIDLMTRMQKQLAMIAAQSPSPMLAQAARKSARFAMACALQQLPYEADRQALQALHQQLFPVL